ncbi:MAG: HAD-IIA family hydrolase [Magnetococcales bacterium]|nr:HAD-IIA family hydrolase [Magnetococcales bacterium]
MGTHAKAKILSQDQLTPYYLRYRERLCADQPTLDERLLDGKMVVRERFSDLAAEYDAIFFDAYGVLNMGELPIAGAAAALTRQRLEGRPFRIVSNNASQSPQTLMSRYRSTGFDVTSADFVTSGMAALFYLEWSPLRGHPYLLVGTADSRAVYAPHPERLMVNHHDSPWPLAAADYILFCSDRDYHGTNQQTQTLELLSAKRVPLLLANPDLVAPKEDGRPDPVAGYTAALLEDQFSIDIHGIGKPFPPIFRLAMAQLPGIPPERILMVGDTLDTDILGGAAMGFATCLTLSGIYGHNLSEITRLADTRGIRPDYIVANICE